MLSHSVEESRRCPPYRKPEIGAKELQRWILPAILNRIPVHPLLHGFVKGRSIVSFVAPHAGNNVVLRLDLQNFFPTFRVQAFFRTLGYPEQVADRLGAICTNRVPFDFWTRRPLDISANLWRETRDMYMRPHLPQGAPISPLLSNLYLTEVDRMLEKAIESTRYGKYTSIQYARFADDLVILIDAHPRHDWLVKAVTSHCGRSWPNCELRLTRRRSGSGPCKGGQFWIPEFRVSPRSES